MRHLILIGGDNPPPVLPSGEIVDRLVAHSQVADLLGQAGLDYHHQQVYRLGELLHQQGQFIQRIEQVRGPITYPHPAWEVEDDQEVIAEPDIEQMADWDGDNIVSLWGEK